MPPACPFRCTVKDVLTQLPAMTNQDDIALLTPAKWKP
jgi:hypothetical protein